ncbi:MAG: hypothetical protein IPK13_21820 [Deltaproteobacteria bacterium]|nr:hypothetical protein [Deltaproteobacteria bacterium]
MWTHRGALPLRTLALVSVALACGGSRVAFAEGIDQAIRTYNEDKYADAAFLFYDVMLAAPDPATKGKAEYYLAHSLYKAGYLLPAYQFYGEVFTSGEGHPYFLKAVRGLLRVAAALDDDTLVPGVIDRGYSRAFGYLAEADSDAAHYLIGMITQRRGNYAEAKSFLEAVGERSPYYAKARYLLAIMAVKTVAEQGSDDYSEAIRYFSEVERRLGESKANEDKKLHHLAVLGKARAYYSQGDFKGSVEFYEKVPRFSEDWYDAMFESGWAYFQTGQFGRALGMVHAIQSPYFDDRYRAESWVLKATTYFQLCHFDRVRKTLDDFFRLYEPVAEALIPWLEGEHTDAEMVEVVVDGNPAFPEQIRRQLANNRRFARFLGHVRRVDSELARATAEFPEGRFKAALLSFFEQEREQRVALTGKLVRQQLKREVAFLDDFLNQARIIKFETADAERKMLEAGKDITKGPRAKGPRPIVPDATYQYWAFLGEYWLDELGYYEHSIKNECVPEVFE